jgi:hypothetical protein
VCRQEAAAGERRRKDMKGTICGRRGGRRRRDEGQKKSTLSRGWSHRGGVAVDNHEREQRRVEEGFRKEEDRDERRKNKVKSTFRVRERRRGVS